MFSITRRSAKARADRAPLRDDFAAHASALIVLAVVDARCE